LTTPGRDHSRLPRDPRELLALLVLAIVLLIPISWGADGQFAWDNSIVPTEVLRAMANGFSSSQLLTYGPVPYYLFAGAIAVVLVPLKLLGELGAASAIYPWGFRHPESSMTLLVTAAHLVTMMLAMGLTVMALRRARPYDLGWLAPILLLGSPVFAFYARTSNVDMHYLFWVWLAFFFCETSTSVGGLRWAGVAAALAVCSKEQVAPLSAIATLEAMWRASRLGPEGKRVPDSASAAAKAFRNWRAAASVSAAAVLAYAIAWRLPFGFESWRLHHDFIFHVAKYPRTYPATPVGFLGLGVQSMGQLQEVLGLPILVGIVLAIALRASWRGLGTRIVACLTYGLLFLGAIGYTYERFLLPFLLVGVPLAVRGYRAAFDVWATRPSWRAVLVGLALGTALTGGPMMSWVMLKDPRYDVERWLQHVPAGTTVEIAGNPHYQARMPRKLKIVYTRADSIRARPRGPVGELVLTSSIDRYSYERDPVIRKAWFEALYDVGRYKRMRFPRASSGPIWDFEIPEIDVYVRATSPLAGDGRAR
jgi:hypothetical protein